MTVAVAGTTGVVRVDESHASALAAFYREVWDANATIDNVLAARRESARQNLHGAGVDLPTFVFFDKDRIVGHITTIPVHVWSQQRTTAAHWLKGLMVLPEYRNGPVGYMVVRQAIQELGCALAAAVAPEARRLFEAVGFKDVGVIANRIKIIEYGNVLRGLANADASDALPNRVRSTLKRAAAPRVNALMASAAAVTLGTGTRAFGYSPTPGWVLTELDPGQLEQLWDNARAGMTSAVARTPAYLSTRYGRHTPYRWIGVIRNGRLAGFGAIKPPSTNGDPRLNGVRVATLAELVFNPRDTQCGLALLQTAEQVAAGLGADALLCSASHKALLSLLNRRAYLPYPGNIHLLAREGANVTFGSIEQWWLTRGDSAADEVL